jgi:hypothetical protein
LRIPSEGATLGDVKALLGAFVLVSLLLATAPAAAQSLPGRQGVPGGRPPDAIDRARGTATQPFSTVPPPARPTERYVPERRVYSPTLGREVVVPGHYEREVSPQRVEVPPLVITNPDGRNPVVVPGGERPPVEQRSAP